MKRHHEGGSACFGHQLVDRFWLEMNLDLQLIEATVPGVANHQQSEGSGQRVWPPRTNLSPSGIGTAPRREAWLPRRQQARPSAALDDCRSIPPDQP